MIENEINVKKDEAIEKEPVIAGTSVKTIDTVGAQAYFHFKFAAMFQFISQAFTPDKGENQVIFQILTFLYDFKFSRFFSAKIF